MRAVVPTPEAAALALRMEKHFGHKVAVERRDGVVHVSIAPGRFELDPSDDALEIRLHPADPAQLPRLQQVVASHLERFARTPVHIAWESPLNG